MGNEYFAAGFRGCLAVLPVRPNRCCCYLKTFGPTFIGFDFHSDGFPSNPRTPPINLRKPMPHETKSVGMECHCVVLNARCTEIELRFFFRRVQGFFIGVLPVSIPTNRSILRYLDVEHIRLSTPNFALLPVILDIADVIVCLSLTFIYTKLLGIRFTSRFKYVRPYKYRCMSTLIIYSLFRCLSKSHST